MANTRLENQCSDRRSKFEGCNPVERWSSISALGKSGWKRGMETERASTRRGSTMDLPLIRATEKLLSRTLNKLPAAFPKKKKEKTQTEGRKRTSLSFWHRIAIWQERQFWHECSQDRRSWIIARTRDTCLKHDTICISTIFTFHTHCHFSRERFISRLHFRKTVLERIFRNIEISKRDVSRYYFITRLISLY